MKKNPRSIKSKAFLCFAFSSSVFAFSLSAFDQELELKTAKPAYWRYEVVPFSFDAHSQLDPQKYPLLALQVRHDGELVPMVGGREEVLMRYRAETKRWEASWLIPWNPSLGDYKAEVIRPEAPLEDPVYAGKGSIKADTKPCHGEVLAKCHFEIQGREPKTLPPGFSVMTLEPGKSGYRKFHGVYDSSQHWSHIIEWGRWMYADAFWHCVGETQIWNHRGEDYPWDRENLRMAGLLSNLAHQQGLLYGGYMVTFLVLGDEFRQADYTFTTGYDQHNDTLYYKHFVSLDDPQRHKDLIGLIKRLDSMENVDFIGMDYVRTDFGGLEFADQFISDAGIHLPDELSKGPLENRQKWLGKIAVTHADPYVEEMWQWWRAHKVCSVLKNIFEQAQVKKPVWVFSLGWMQGHQHGQDPCMLIDAGVSFNAPMFYEADNKQYPEMLKSWHEYLQHCKASLVLGQPVDAKLLREEEERGGPEVLYQRHLEALDQLGPLAKSLGFFWHDISRAMAGGRSIYSGREWAVAGAASFSRLREVQKVLPVHVDFGGAWSEPWGVSFTVMVENLSNSPISRLAVDGLPVRGIGSYLPASMEFGPLEAHGNLTIPWSATWSSDPSMDNNSNKPLPDRRMLATRVRLPVNVSRYPAISFTYVRVHRSKSENPPVDVSSTEVSDSNLGGE